MPHTSNTRTLLLTSAGTLLLVAATRLTYPPGSAITDPTNGVVLGYRTDVPLAGTLAASVPTATGLLLPGLRLPLRPALAAAPRMPVRGPRHRPAAG